MHINEFSRVWTSYSSIVAEGFEHTNLSLNDDVTKENLHYSSEFYQRSDRIYLSAYEYSADDKANINATGFLHKSSGSIWLCTDHFELWANSSLIVGYENSLTLNCVDTITSHENGALISGSIAKMRTGHTLSFDWTGTELAIYVDNTLVGNVARK